MWDNSNLIINFLFLHRLSARKLNWLTCGVIGNTSDFGSEDSWFEPRQVNEVQDSKVLFWNLFKNFNLCTLTFNLTLSCGVIGNTSDSGSEKFRFEPWQDNKIWTAERRFFI